MEGGGRSWFWDESAAVDGGLQLIGNGLGHSVALPKLERFNPRCGGLKVVYKGGAVGELPIISTFNALCLSAEGIDISYFFYNLQSDPILKYSRDPRAWEPLLVAQLFRHMKLSKGERRVFNHAVTHCN